MEFYRYGKSSYLHYEHAFFFLYVILYFKINKKIGSRKIDGFRGISLEPDERKRLSLLVLAIVILNHCNTIVMKKVRLCLTLMGSSPLQPTAMRRASVSRMPRVQEIRFIL